MNTLFTLCVRWKPGPKMVSKPWSEHSSFTGWIKHNVKGGRSPNSSPYIIRQRLLENSLRLSWLKGCPNTVDRALSVCRCKENWIWENVINNPWVLHQTAWQIYITQLTKTPPVNWQWYITSFYPIRHYCGVSGLHVSLSSSHTNCYYCFHTFKTFQSLWGLLITAAAEPLGWQCPSDSLLLWSRLNTLNTGCIIMANQQCMKINNPKTFCHW